MAIYTLFHHDLGDQEHAQAAERVSAAGLDGSLGASPRIVTTGGNPFPSAKSGAFCPAVGFAPSENDCRVCKFRYRPWCLLGGEAA